MKSRVLVAIPIVIIVALAVFVQGWVLAVFATVLALACQFEVVRAMDANGRPLVKSVAYIFAALLAVLFLHDFYTAMFRPEISMAWLTADTVLFLLISFTMAAFIVAMFSKRHNAQSVISTAFTFFYPQMFYLTFYFLILRCTTSAAEYGGYRYLLLALLLLFAIPMLTDTAAFLVGRKLGKHKLCPAISPKKTVEGALGGIAGGVVGGILIWAVVNMVARHGGHSVLMNSLPAYIMFGAILSVVAQLGDLAASFIKRSLNIKDFGKLLPGHGGIVDRTDSTMFCMPVVFLLALLQLL